AGHGGRRKEWTAEGGTPPGHADPRHGKFVNARRLSREDVRPLAAWVDAGMPRGDARDLPRPIDWPAGWALGKPDAVFTMPQQFEVPADGTLPYKYFTVETGFNEDRWVKTAEARPGAAGVVHHVVVY